jgi:hypothetical protein
MVYILRKPNLNIEIIIDRSAEFVLFTISKTDRIF